MLIFLGGVGGVYSSCFVYPLFFSAFLYMIFLLLNMPMLDELSDSLRLINIGICLMIEGGWFEEVCVYK